MESPEQQMAAPKSMGSSHECIKEDPSPKPLAEVPSEDTHPSQKDLPRQSPEEEPHDVPFSSAGPSSRAKYTIEVGIETLSKDGV